MSSYKDFILVRTIDCHDYVCEYYCATHMNSKVHPFTLFIRTVFSDGTFKLYVVDFPDLEHLQTRYSQIVEQTEYSIKCDK